MTLGVVFSRQSYLLHHIFLPPKLPQQSDGFNYDSDLLETVIEALRGFKVHVPNHKNIIAPSILMLTRLKDICGPDGNLDEAKLTNAFLTFINSKFFIPGGVLPIHIREQNAAVLLAKEGEGISIEAFELSPLNEAVNTTMGRLQRQFPGPTFLLDQATFSDNELRGVIAQTLAKMSHQSAPGTKTKVKKKGTWHDEDRDTANPKMVTEFFNTREEVLYINCQFPWRRSPLWLLIRSTLQLVFRRLSAQEGVSDDLYKQFMVYLLSVILNSCSRQISDKDRYIMSAKIGRRLCKLDLSYCPSWFQYVQDVLERTGNVISSNWAQIRGQNNLMLECVRTHELSKLDFSKDVNCSLPGIDLWIERLKNHENLQMQADTVSPSLPNLEDPDYNFANLAAFERWIHDNLDLWLQLYRLTRGYYNNASPLYSSNPESLWIACDKVSKHHHTMLADYDSQIPLEIFETLVLPYKSQLERLSRAEDYLRRCKQQIRYPSSNIFRDYGTPGSFSVRYFDESAEHQALLATIEKKASQKRAEKKAELRAKQQRYTDLMNRVDQTKCEYYEYRPDRRFDYTESIHASYCSRYVHEWPLPSDGLKKKTTVFELRVPRPFAFWRDITIFFLIRVLRISYGRQWKPRATYQPETYGGLASLFRVSKPAQTFSLLSEDKPHSNTHRKGKRIIDVHEEDICLENALNFHYFDNALGCFVAELKDTTELGSACTYKLPPATSTRNGPAPNTIIASQAASPKHISLEEYKALCSMPYGLAIPSVVLRKDETCIFILQIICQAGPSIQSSILRAGHAVLDQQQFVIALLTQIRDTAEKIKENWESAQELMALIFLIQRVLSLSTLKGLRAIAFKWVMEVRDTAGTTDSDTRRLDLMARSAHIALICVATFDSEGATLEQIFQNPSDAAIYIQCCMIAPGSLLQILHHRWRVLAYRCHSIIAHNVVEQKKPIMDKAIQMSWAAYRAGSAWSLALKGSDYWLVTSMESGTATNGGLLVHFNLITGELLVNGQPLSRLPSDYERHETYKLLFGRSLVEVMPSDIPGMQFSGQRKHMNQTLHMGKDPLPDLESFDLCIRAVDEGRVWEFVPTRLFEGAFPDAFVHDYAHWYDLENGHIEFRPVNEPWKSSETNWVLQQSQGQSSWSLVKNGLSLITGILGPIEQQSRLHCKLHTASSELEIEVPRSSSLRSRTLIGLRNKLVLVGEDGNNRRVIIPEGKVTWKKDKDHVAVEIGWQAISNAHVYAVNVQLGRLADNGSLQSKLFLYPLTMKTGTEQSLSILQSASVRSFSQLKPENTAILEYYPANERVMQSIGWNQGLGYLSQHNDFYEQVVAIFNQNHQMGMFYPDSQASQHTLPSVNEPLLRRDNIRSSSFRTSGFGAEAHTTEQDHRYTERGRDYQSEQCSRVFALCKTLYDELPSTEVISETSLLSTIWTFLSEPDEITYDATWLLKEASTLLSTKWCSAHQLLSLNTGRPNKYQVMIWLSTLTLPNKIDLTILKVFAALYIIPDMATIEPPSQLSFNPQKGYELRESELRSRINTARLAETPETNISPGPQERYHAFRARIQRLKDNNIQWPISSPFTPNCNVTPKFAREMFSAWFGNRELRSYLSRIASVYSSHHAQVPALRIRGFVCTDDVLDAYLEAVPLLEVGPPALEPLLYSAPGITESTPRLQDLVAALKVQAESEYERRYVDQLQGSTMSLREIRQPDRITITISKLKEIVSGYLSRCESHYAKTYKVIFSRMTLSGGGRGVADQEGPVRRCLLKILAKINIGPRVSPDLFLRQLTRQRWSHLSTQWKACYIAYGCAITALQRAKRLVGLIDHQEDLIRELQNPGHTNWDTYSFPESLLLEIENGILIREVQEQIAQEMRDTKPGRNSVMQLNMGEGKSSTIVPIVAAALADGSCLMFQMLVSRLGGLIGRRVYHMPAAEIERMCLECKTEGGVLLVQPEHILSLKLMCLESFINEKEAFFHASSRDVFELIYTMGSQRPLEYSPERWIMAQQLLDLVRKYAPAVKEKFPQLIEVEEQGLGSFPRTRLLGEHATQELLRIVTDHICNNGIGSLPISRQPEAIRNAVFAYILNPDLSEQQAAAVEDDSAASFWTDSTRDPLLLIRGLIAGGVLASCFGQKRWRVNYGPHHARKPSTSLSVPYRAKDNPAPRSEFSHPEVVVMLTCLSHYYAGLDNDELIISLRHLIKSDQADIEYQSWVDDAPSLPQAYRQLNGINLQDCVHCVEHIFPSLRLSKGAIDYFLAHIVFPKEMKEFPYKLSASGWDIGEIKALPTAGFSGTNDSRVTLPLSVEQLDLPEQNHTNALVLEYLLQPENSVHYVPERDESITDAQALLDLVMVLDPPTQVILDVGAQILELTNVEVAQSWLKMIPDNSQKQAVVFVNDNDEICVVDKTGLIEPLQISPFVNQLDACLVFLDEAHTRGIDLRLPRDYRAAVTLGAGITKDKLVQACMRLRKLGKGQSVVFCIPQEIKTKILSLIGKPDDYQVEVSDVLRWSVSETWIEMQRSIPLWAVQGQRFERQDKIWQGIRGNSQEMTKDQAEGFLEPESQTLDQRYRPRHGDTLFIDSETEESENTLRIQERCREFANLKFAATQLQEEQERQLAPEIEQERQVQRPAMATPEKHHLHPDLVKFVSTGILDETSTAFMPAFESFRKTSAAKYLNVSEFGPGLLVTQDFARTVKMPKGPSSTLDDYQRPVQWILTSVVKSKWNVHHMVIISPFEANELHSKVQKSKAPVALHSYAPRQNRSYSPLDKLDLYTVSCTEQAFLIIPTFLRVQLNIFAGQLYISSFQEYLEICDALGLSSSTAPEGVTVAADGFILQENAPFTQSPLRFLRSLMSQIRRDGQEIDKTHFGKILDGKLLGQDDFQSLDSEDD
ncbi:hypothetical protein BJY04DRAFT_225986 [Aspergillus karnatakaensis]|uniref:uncharacterized protein n=1 Tax=Aspergillus karnatakaensis TaxID=1810916 RepID=UPI003CCE50F6